MYSSGITWNKDGKISSIWEDDRDHGHSEGGFTRRDSPNFEKELDDYLRGEPYYEIVELTKKTDKDPVLRKVLAKLLLDLMIGASPIIKEAKNLRKKEEEEAKKKAEENAKKPFRRRITMLDGTIAWYDVTYKPNGSYDKITRVEDKSRKEDISR